MEQKRPHDAKVAPPSFSAYERLQQGADAELLQLFGLTRDSRDKAALEAIDSGRREILWQGFLVHSDAPDIDPSLPELLALGDHGNTVYPNFQFLPNSTRVRPEVAQVNQIMTSAQDVLPWELAFWWMSNNGALDGLTPLAVLQAGDAELLLEAARREMDTP